MKYILQKEIQRLNKELLALGAIVEELLRKSVRALQERDVKLAREVIEADERVDNREVELEESGLKIIALHQPVAIDLRFIVSVLRINSDLERIGDLAVNIAERATYLAGAEVLPVTIDFNPMAEKSQEMLTKSLDAFVNMDSTLGRQILDMDNEVDAMNRQMYCTIYEMIRKNPEDVEVLLHLLSASRHLERIADHATNIAEDVIYMVEGRIVRHKPEEYPVSESCEGNA